jgi:pimeloyl-ACP methyl ester carboxylesterase
LANIFDHLINDCEWSPQNIHILGFAQGGTVAVEFALLRWKQQLQKNTNPSISPVGSVVSICGPLLSYPTLKPVCPIPLLLFHRSPPAESALSSNDMAAFRKGFGSFWEAQVCGEGMPRSKTEWEHIMGFWSEQLGRRQMGGLHQVM